MPRLVFSRRKLFAPIGMGALYGKKPCLNEMEPWQSGGNRISDVTFKRLLYHCAQPILRRFGHESSVRPSLALYNTCSDIDALIASLHRLTAGRPH